MADMHRFISGRRVRDLFPGEVLDALAGIARNHPSGIYLAGGTVRDLLLDRPPADIDLTVCCHGRRWARELVRLRRGTYVELGRDEDAGRAVLAGLEVDFSSFRGGAVTIEEDLELRDLTVNALALPLDPLLRGGGEELPLIDPLGGREDLAAGRARFCSGRAIVDDPLRMVRLFRFAAVLGLAIESRSLEQVREKRRLVERIAAERIGHELDLIMASGRARPSVEAMRACGLLFVLIPEMEAGVGMEQPASHHLDVFDHLVEALGQAEKIADHPERYYPEAARELLLWLAGDDRRTSLMWSALLHDLGKPFTWGINEDKGGRITFYNHDRKGAILAGEVGERLRWSRKRIRLVTDLVRLHMRPFFLANHLRQGNLTLRACLRLVTEAGDRLAGLFLVAMADGLAGKGEASPVSMEEELACLLSRLIRVREEHVRPVRQAPPLITGRDLIHELGWKPGPLFRRVLSGVERARMEGRIITRDQALAWAREQAPGTGGEGEEETCAG